MAQPILVPGALGKGVNAKFGGLPLPNGQGTMTYIDLNDRTTWQLDGVTFDHPPKLLSNAPRIYRGKGTWQAEDFGPRTVMLAARYLEQPGVPIGAALPTLLLAGEQYLTFDNAVTALKAKFSGVQHRWALTDYLPFIWGLELGFLAVDPWYADLAATTGSANVTAASGTPVAFNVTYPGSVWCEPVFTFTTPIGNTAVYTQLKITNTMSGESITIAIPAYAAGAHTIVLDSSKFIAYLDTIGLQLDPLGTGFPMLYGPAGTVNAFTITMTYTGAIVGVPTIGWSFNSRWDL